MKRSRKVFWILGIVLGIPLLLALVFGALIGSAFQGNQPLPEGGADLTGGVRLVKDGHVAFFVLPTGQGELALVDCGNDPAGKELLAELVRRRARPEEVKTILLTHGHGDHTAGCHLFPGAQVLALAPDVGLAAGTEKSHGLLTRFFGNGPDRAVRVTRPLADGQVVQLGELAVQVFAVPGHTTGSAAYLAAGVLYLGDSANSTKEGQLVGAPKIFSDDPAVNRASLRALARRLKEAGAEVRILAFAHSAPLNGLAPLDAFAALPGT
jgi:hydroxyacylglutathione hydrolase